MAFETGTATDHVDLLAKLTTFLTTDAALVAAGEEWTVAWSAPVGAPNLTDVVFEGPGLSGTEQIFVGLSLTENPALDSYVLWSRGLTGVLPAGVGIADHVNRSPLVGMYLDPNPMTYWFVANGRRFVVVVKISTVFEAMYAGLYLPYALPTTYPYPFFIGGSRGATAASPENWRSIALEHSHFINPWTLGGASNPTYESCAWMLDASAQWIRCWNGGTNLGDPKIGMAPRQFFDGMGITADPSLFTSYGYNYVRKRTAQGFDDSFLLTPVTMVQQTPSDQTYGVLQGVYRCPGANNSSENIITVDGVDHLVVQNCFRTDTGDYWALALA